jgi:NADPH:quinone reductase-like Zn-dependent oxidoreductase
MRAIVLDRYGGPEVFRYAEVATPVARPGEILIRIHATVATPPDVAFRSARPFIARAFAGWLKPKTAILGGSLAGELAAVGAGVTRFKRGDRLFGAAEWGTYAQYMRLPAEAAIAPMPPAMGYEEACAISEGYLTAMPFLRDEARLEAGQRVLINGASGSVGTSAVQLAREFGAHVTGVCSTRNIELVRSLGADAVIDYTHQDFTQTREAYDVIFDAVGKSSFARCRKALKANGIYMTTVPSLSILWRMLKRRDADGKRGLLATTGLRSDEMKRRDLELMVELYTAGKLRAVIDRRYALSEMAEAHRYVETGHKRGSVVVTVN